MTRTTPPPLNQAPVRAVLQRLLEAHELASAAHKPPWEFAVEVATLADLGASYGQVRWLIAEGLVEVRSETTTAAARRRTFRKLGSLTLPDRSCLLLSAAGLQTACTLAKTDAATTAHPSLKRHPADQSAAVRPHWDSQRRQLHFNGQLVKAFRVPAPNQETLLTAFEQAGWPACIDSPLNYRDQGPKQHLQQTIRALNRCRVRALLRFRGDGTGNRVCWEAARVRA